MAASNNDTPLPRWAYVLLACLAAGIGLASSAITAQFFVLGLERAEPDAVARDLLIATGFLIVATELAAFGVAALLPVHQLRSLRYKLMVCGSLLLAFEATTIYATQVTLLQVSEAAGTASSTRVADLRVSIDQRRQAAKGLRENGALQSASSNAWTRTLGANALRDALKVEQGIEPLSAELMQLQRESKPAMSSVLGQEGMLWYSVARALLISVMGLFMFGAAGALLREARGLRRKAETCALDSVQEVKPATPVHLPFVVYSIPALQTSKVASSVCAGNVVQFKSEPPKAPPATEHPRAEVSMALPAGTELNSEISVPLLPSHSNEPTHLPKKASSRIGKLIAEGWCRKIPSITGSATRMLQLKRA